MSKLCIRCGQVMNDDAVFCVKCGTRQAAARSERVIEAQPVMTESMHHPVGASREPSQRLQPSQPYYRQQQRDYQPPQNNYTPPAYQPALQQTAKKKSRKRLVIGLISGFLAIVIAGLAVLYFFGPFRMTIKQSSPEELLDSTCSVLEKSLGNKKMFNKNELNAIYEYKYGEKSAKHIVEGYYNIIAGYVTSDDYNLLIKQGLGSNIKITYEIINKTEVDSSRYDDYFKNGMGVPTDKIDEMYIYDLAVTLKGSRNSDTENISIPLVKADNKWYFALGQYEDPLFSSYGAYSSYGSIDASDIYR